MQYYFFRAKISSTSGNKPTLGLKTLSNVVILLSSIPSNHKLLAYHTFTNTLLNIQ